MRFLLCVTLVVLAFVALSNAQCYFSELTITNIKNPPKGCQDESGVMREFGAEWVKDCYECNCSPSGIGCCNKIPIAVGMPPECEIIVDREKCTSKAVLKADKSKECVPV